MTLDYYEEEDFQSNFSGKTILRIVGLTRKHWKWVLGFLFSISVVSILDSLFTYLSKQIVDEGIIAQNSNVLINIIKLYGGLVVVQALGVFGFIYLVGILGERIRYDLRQSMFAQLQRLSLSYYGRTPVGWIMSRVTSDSDRVAELVTWGVLDITWSATNILTSMAFMIFINWRLSIIVFLMLPVVIFVAIEFRKRILKEYRIVRRLNSKLTGAYNETITGVRIIKALGREKGNAQEFSSISGEMYHAGYRAAWLSALFLPAVQMITAIALGSIVYYAGFQVQFGGVTIGGIQAFVSYIIFMMWPIQEMARVFAEMQRAIASAERIFSLIDAKPEVTDQPGAFDPGTIQGDIEFNHVTFSYEDNQPVLNDFSLVVKRGETVALVGPTGGGKTTIINLLCRFYEPKLGEIRIGGEDYKNFSLHALQSRIGLVLQTPHLFSGTIRENIRYGNLGATDKEIEEAVKLAGAEDFIHSFSNGYDEQTGEGGSLLSIGQKQLISLARAILVKPEIFIMDEATSSVDTLTEKLIQQSMDALISGCTSFVIAHRLSTIKQADRILVIENGEIAEIGTHTELIRRQGKYFQLYTKQFRQQMEQAYHPFQDSISS
jgi:ATP-binding cassette, subfamily B, bacterial